MLQDPSTRPADSSTPASRAGGKARAKSGLLERCPSSFDPERPDFAPYGLTCVRWHPSPMRRPDHHNEVELNFLDSGTLTYLLGGRKSVVNAGQLTVFWAAIPHQILEFASESPYYVATVPLPWFLQWRLPQGFVQRLLQGQIIQDVPGRNISIDSKLFSQWEDDLRIPREATKEAVLLEMHARLIRLAEGVQTDRSGAKTRNPMASLTDAGLRKVEQMACFVAQNYRDKITVRDVANIVKLHPNYAMGLFQRTFGTTLVTYLTQHRVSHAQRLLTTSNLTMIEVAFDSGFNSLSRFNDAFRRICGCAPREYRRANFSPTLADSGGFTYS